LILLIAIALNAGVTSYSQEVEEEETEYTEEVSNRMKAIHADVGYFGPAGLSAALGFRYWFASFTLGLSGLTSNIPNYSPYGYELGIYPHSPLPANYISKNYAALVVTGDFSFYYPVLKKVNVFGTLGFYSQQDSVLAWDITDDVYYFWRNKKTSGFCFGAGAEFDYQDNLKLGIGYHTKRGLFARLAYFWF
jgi:opacity protein-like surface antigen